MKARSYIFHGIKIKIKSDIPEVFSIFQKIFDLKPKNIERYDLNLVFSLKTKSQAISLPKKAVKLHLKRIRNINGAFDGNKLYLTDKKSWVRIDYKQNKAVFIIDKATLRSAKLMSHTLLPLALIELLKKYGFYYVHSACADINGKGVLFIGGPGTGKTTACYSLIRKKANWVSDDAVLIKKSGKQIIAHSFIKEFSLLTGKHGHFSELKKINRGLSQKCDISSKLSAKFRLKTVPKLILLTDPKPSDLKTSDVIGTIIRENEFLFLHQNYARKVITNLQKLARQCKTPYINDRSLILDSNRFSSYIAKLLS